MHNRGKGKTFKQWDFRHDKTHERNGKGRRTNKRLPLVHPENGSKDFQVQLRLLGIGGGPYVLSFEPSGEKFLREILVRRKTIEINRDDFPLEMLSIQRGQSAFQGANEQLLFDRGARRVGDLGGNRTACEQGDAHNQNSGRDFQHTMKSLVLEESFASMRETIQVESHGALSRAILRGVSRYPTSLASAMGFEQKSDLPQFLTL